METELLNLINYLMCLEFNLQITYLYTCTLSTGYIASRTRPWSVVMWLCGITDAWAWKEPCSEDFMGHMLNYSIVVQHMIPFSLFVGIN